jgi:lipoprotein-releasing system permease protein
LPLELRIALRYLTARRKQALLSVISLIQVLGVVVGVMALFIALALMTGLQNEIRSMILGTTAHISVFSLKSRSEGFENYRQATLTVRQVPRVLGSAPTVYGKVLISSPAASDVATIKGILPKLEQTVTDLAGQIATGSLAPIERHGEADALAPVLLGQELASKLAVGVGDVVNVTSPQGRLSPLGMLPRQAKLRVVGTVKSGLWEFDSTWAYVPFGVAQRLFDKGDSATLVEVRVDDMYEVKRIAPQLLSALGDGYQTYDWIEMNSSLFRALWLEKTAIAITIGLIVAVAALSIVATLVLMVMEKHKDIGILVSMGASRGQVTRIFVLQGTLIGVMGTLVGSLLGVLACYVLDTYKLIRVPADVYQIAYVPFKLLPGDAAIVVGGAMLVCFLATIHPARRAARVDPAEALRYE